MGANTSEHTATKQADFRRIIGLQVKIVKKVWNLHDWRPPVYLYLDLYSGPGIYNDLHYSGFGSPLIAIEVLKRARVDYRCHLFNIDNTECFQLRACLNGDSNTSVYWGDNNRELPKLGDNHNVLGLAYLDPNNVLPDFDMADKVQRKFKRLDLLFYFGAAFDKRVRCAFDRPIGEGYSLVERMSRLDKKKWIVKEPTGKQQYTFLLATNADIGDWKKQGWHDIESHSGWEILRRLNYTATELKNGDQMRLV